MQTLACGDGGKGKRQQRQRQGERKGPVYAGTNEEDETEDTADHQEKEESEQQSEGTTDDVWWLGSMNALTGEPKIRWACPRLRGVRQKQFCSYRERCHARGWRDPKEDDDATFLGRRKKVSWSQGPQ